MWVTILTGIIALFLGFGSGWVASDLNDNTRPPKIMKQDITTIQRTEVQTSSEMRNYQVQSTSIYNGLSNQQFLFAITNQLSYSNLQRGDVTNKNSSDTVTNNSVDTN